MNTCSDNYKDIICIATKRIDDNLPTNVQQLMLRLAEKHRVLYIEPPVDSVFIARNPAFMLREQYLKSICPKFLKPIWAIIFPYERWVPFFLRSLNRKKIIASIKHAIRTFQIKPEIVWIFRPQDYWIAEHLNPTYLCYHITDKYNTMPINAKSKNDALKLDRLEAKVVKNADLIFCTAKSLWKEASTENRKSFFVGNVADVKHFGKANDPETKIPEDIADLRHPVAGFFGAIDSFKLDFDLINITAKTLSKGSVALIGPIKESANTKNHKKPPQGENIYYLGTKDYFSLVGYLKKFDVCIIPYKNSEYTQHVFPLKFFEYLAAGKPIVSTSLPALNDFKDYFYRADSEAEWAKAIINALNENDTKKQLERKTLARNNCWESRIRNIESILRTL